MTRPRPFTDKQIARIVAWDDANGCACPDPVPSCFVCEWRVPCDLIDDYLTRDARTIAAQSREIARLKAVAVEAVTDAITESAECYLMLDGRYICDPPLPDCTVECSGREKYVRWMDALGLTRADLEVCDE